MSDINSYVEDKIAFKADTEKLKYQLIPPYAMKQIARVFTFGAGKYGELNWEQGFKWTRILGAMERHIAAFKAGVDFDPESGLYHLASPGS